MQLLIDFFPLLLFFIAYTWQGIYVATGVAMVASILQIAWIHWKHGRAGVVHWLSLVIIVVFGGAKEPGPGYRRYIENRFRREFGFEGVPVRFSYRPRAKGGGAGERR